MPRTMTCDQCSMDWAVSDASAGMHIRCEYCEAWVQVPESLADGEADVPPAMVEPARAEPVSPDRPRKRRRPQPKPRSAWPLIAVILLSLFVLCGGLFFWVERPEWRPYDSPGGDFSVELPAPPSTDMKRDIGIKGNERMEGTILFSRLEEYVIVSVEIDPRRTKTNDQIIEEGLQGLIANKTGTRIIHDVRVTISGLPAREVGVSIPGAGQMLSRLVVVGNRFHMVAAGGRFAKFDDPRLRRFVDSFLVKK